MDYVQHLRQYVGHCPLPMVGAAALIVEEQNRLLLLKRSDSGCWGTLGGSVELGEVVEAAARREVREEISLELGELTLSVSSPVWSCSTAIPTEMKSIM